MCACVGHVHCSTILICCAAARAKGVVLINNFKGAPCTPHLHSRLPQLATPPLAPHRPTPPLQPHPQAAPPAHRSPSCAMPHHLPSSSVIR
jgi:hypothetical protein